jgi:hypothetical protein
MIYPLVSKAPEANEHMPSKVKEIYEEARNIAAHSARSAAALLRVALEVLTKHLGVKGKSLNERIKNLKEKGLPQQIIDCLDIVRVYANEGGSHAGAIDLTGKDGKEVVDKLFWLVNKIVQHTIEEPKEIEKLKGDIPKNKKKGIKDRDKK